MVNNSDPTTPAPTQDALDHEQAQLDAQQTGSTQEAQYVTVDQHNQLQAQLRTVQGMLHKGLNTATNNAIQGAKSYFDTELAKMNQGAQTDRMMASVPEENQEWMRPIVEAALQNQPAQPQVTTGTGDAGAAPGGASQEELAMWEQWAQVAEGYGLNRNDPRIQWGRVTDGSTAVPALVVQMGQHFQQLAANQAPAAPVRPPVPQQQLAPAPPVEGGAGPAAINDGSFEALLDQIATKKITRADAVKVAAQNGWTL
jgi:hypothetical protein